MNIIRMYLESLIINYYPTTVSTSDERIKYWLNKSNKGDKNEKSK